MQQHSQNHDSGTNMSGQALLSMLQRKRSFASEHQQQPPESGLESVGARSAAPAIDTNTFVTPGTGNQEAQHWQLWGNSPAANTAAQQQPGSCHLASLLGSAQVHQQQHGLPQQQSSGSSNLQRLLSAAARHAGPASPPDSQQQHQHQQQFFDQAQPPPAAAGHHMNHGQQWQQLTSSQPLFSGSMFDQPAVGGPFGMQQQPDQLLGSRGRPPGFGAPGTVPAAGAQGATKAPPPGFQHLAHQHQQQQPVPSFGGGSLFSQQPSSLPEQSAANQQQQQGLPSLYGQDIQRDAVLGQQQQQQQHQGLSSLFGPSSSAGEAVNSSRDLAGLLRNALQSPQQQQQQQMAQLPEHLAVGSRFQDGLPPQQDPLSGRGAPAYNGLGGFSQQPQPSDSAESTACGLGQPSQLQLLTQQRVQQQQQQQFLMQQEQQQLHQQQLQQQQQHQLLQHLHGMQAGAAAGAAAAGAAAGQAAAAAAVAEQQQYTAGNLPALMARLQLQQQQHQALLHLQQQQQAQQQHNLQLQHMQQLLHHHQQQQQQQRAHDHEELLRQEQVHMLLSQLQHGEQAAASAAATRQPNALHPAAGSCLPSPPDSSGADNTAAAVVNGTAHGTIAAPAAVPAGRRASSPAGIAQSPGGFMSGQGASMLLNRSTSTSGGPKRGTPTLPPPIRLDIRELNEQLLQLASTLAPTAAQRQRQQDAWSSVQSMLQRLWPEGEAHLFGSAANQLDIGNNNDLDVCLELDGMDESKEARGEVVERLGEQLESEGMLQVLAIPRARMPVVKFEHPATGFKVDITVNNRLALVNTKLLKDYAAIDSRLQTLVLLVKYWAKRRRCNEAYVGTLSSYAYVLMCIAHLQCRSPPVLPVLQEMTPTHRRTLGNWMCDFYDDISALAGYGAANTENIAQLLACFFYYWAHQHDYRREVLTVRQSGVLTKAMKGWTTRVGLERHLFCIEDPFELSHDLGRTVHAEGCDKLRREFRRAWDIIRHSASVQQLVAELFAEAPAPPASAGPAPSTPSSGTAAAAAAAAVAIPAASSSSSAAHAILAVGAAKSLP